MNTLKFLNIAFLALILTMILQIFLPKPQTAIPENEISLTSPTKSVTIPTIPTIVINNKTTSDFVYNTCNNLELSANSNPVVLNTFENFCQDVTVKPGMSEKINLTPLYKVFGQTPGQYIFSLKSGNISKNLVVEVENRGLVRSFLSTLVYEPIYNLFAAILSYLPGHPLGWAIIIITIIIRLILLIPQNKMLESQRKMAEINPKLKALQEEYKDDKATLGVKMMELYKKEGVNPMGSCLPLLIQMPILFALYWVISGISDISNRFHLYSFLKDFNPANIDTNFFGVNLLQIGGTLAIVAGLILAATQWLQSYLAVKAQPKPVKKSEKKKEVQEGEMPALDPEMMQKMMLYFFPLMIGVSALFFPLGLALYWWIGIIFMILQQAYVNNRAKQRKLTGEIVKRK